MPIGSSDRSRVSQHEGSEILVNIGASFPGGSSGVRDVRTNGVVLWSKVVRDLGHLPGSSDLEHE